MNAKFIEIWKIVNVHTLYADIRLRDLNRVVIHTPNDENFQKRIGMNNFAKQIANQSSKHVRSLTKDTRNCFSQTCNGLVAIVNPHFRYNPRMCNVGNCHSNPLEKGQEEFTYELEEFTT